MIVTSRWISGPSFSVVSDTSSLVQRIIILYLDYRITSWIISLFPLPLFNSVATEQWEGWSSKKTVLAICLCCLPIDLNIHSKHRYVACKSCEIYFPSLQPCLLPLSLLCFSHITCLLFPRLWTGFSISLIAQLTTSYPVFRSWPIVSSDRSFLLPDFSVSWHPFLFYHSTCHNL